MKADHDNFAVIVITAPSCLNKRQISSRQGVNVKEEMRVNTERRGEKEREREQSRNSFVSLISVTTTADTPAGEN